MKAAVLTHKAQSAIVRVVGAVPDPTVLVEPLVVSRAQLFAPRAATMDGDGALWVADSGHHRVLGWRNAPEQARAADCLLGQPDDCGEARNAGGDLPQAQALNLPVGICRAGSALLVADAWNHRVLVWRQAPVSDRVAPDYVLGQQDLTATAINRGKDRPDAGSLYWPFGLHWDGEHLFVCDAGNRRLLIWHGLPEHTGQPADQVLGQRDFNCRDENGGGTPDARSMRWPHAVCRWQGRLCLADAGNHRVMIWDRLPERSNAPADHLLGQTGADATGSNGGRLNADADVLSMPYGLAAVGDELWVADTANSRLLGWSAARLATGARAAWVFGQPDFQQRGENRWAMPARDSLCWPYGLTASGDQLVVSDTGNHRVLLLPAALLRASR